MNSPKISIIIPSFNRAALIGETLDSMLLQTFTGWECVVIDDHSTDDTVEVLKAYSLKDSRIRWEMRPADRPKGANACRNYGLEISNGDFIQWFDSDDIMLPDFLQKKYDEFMPDIDFVVSRCNNFNEEGKEEEISKYEGNKKNRLNFENFLKEKVYWITQDFLIRKDRLGDVRFNENLQSGQEYNFFMVLLANQKLEGIYLNSRLSLRRIHSTSIQQKLKTDLTKALQSKYLSQSTTFLQVAPLISSSLRIYFLNGLIQLMYQLKLRKEELANFESIRQQLKREKGIFKTKALDLALFLAANYKKGYKFMNYART